jgi:hypothetical protein
MVKLKVDHVGGRFFLIEETYTVHDIKEYPDLELHLNHKEFDTVDIYVKSMKNWTFNQRRQLRPPQIRFIDSIQL